MPMVARACAPPSGTLVMSIGILTAGVVLGLTLDANPGIPQPWNRLSSILGWLYFWSWSVSFYPQILLNMARQSAVGLSLDYAVINTLGFSCYLVFACAFFFSDSVQHQYMARHHGYANSVEPADMLFTVHGAIGCFVTLAQCYIYPNGGQKVSKSVSIAVWGHVLISLLFAAAIAATHNNQDSVINTLNLLYLQSYVKLTSSIVKCVPQIYFNFRRKSTEGWPIITILLDIAGGLFSIAQEVLDSWATGDWSALIGNPVKFLLGLLSILLDVVFVLQHYVWYNKHTTSTKNKNKCETTPLIAA